MTGLCMLMICVGPVGARMHNAAFASRRPTAQRGRVTGWKLPGVGRRRARSREDCAAAVRLAVACRMARYSRSSRHGGKHNDGNGAAEQRSADTKR